MRFSASFASHRQASLAYQSYSPLSTRKNAPQLRGIKLGRVTAAHPVPEHINRPDYTHSDTMPMQPSIKSSQDISQMKKVCQAAADVLYDAGEILRPGTTTEEIDRVVHYSTIDKHHAYPSPLHYEGFPKSVCTSVNDVLCHGIPGILHHLYFKYYLEGFITRYRDMMDQYDRPLEHGDIINIDVTLFKYGFHGDTSRTFIISDGSSPIPSQRKDLMQVTQDALYEGIRVCGPNVPFSHIGRVIHRFVKKHGFSVSKDFTGHGIGRYFHEAPFIFHHRNRYGVNQIGANRMKPGMTFTIEPIVVAHKDPSFKELADRWTSISVHGADTAQFEHTLLITDDGVDIMTEHSNR
eukprot:gb/GECH01004823.1/.p1 GENE.gb/GECH01004823.1/~~gb/GECH01004823.1/.p1  ORF type:complete len:351 (+),score=30.64 gb/GECH01004823.1/:1-1053(+)